MASSQNKIIFSVFPSSRFTVQSMAYRRHMKNIRKGTPLYSYAYGTKDETQTVWCIMWTISASDYPKTPTFAALCADSCPSLGKISDVDVPGTKDREEPRPVHVKSTDASTSTSVLPLCAFSPSDRDLCRDVPILWAKHDVLKRPPIADCKPMPFIAPLFSVPSFIQMVRNLFHLEIVNSRPRTVVYQRQSPVGRCKAVPVSRAAFGYGTRGWGSTM